MSEEYSIAVGGMAVMSLLAWMDQLGSTLLAGAYYMMAKVGVGQFDARHGIVAEFECQHPLLP